MQSQLPKILSSVLGLGCAVVAGVLFLRGTDGRAAPQACETKAVAGEVFTVCALDTAADEVQLVWQGADGRALRRLPALKRLLGDQAGRVKFAMNAGMFEAGGRPLGLFIADGVEGRALHERTGSGNFYLQPNGVFSISSGGAVRVETTAAFAARRAAEDGAVATRSAPQIIWATQSGPMLLSGGALSPAIQPDGTSLHIRNGVCVTGVNTALFLISEVKVSFGTIAKAMQALGCMDGLYLDGAVSSLWAPGLGRMDNRYDLGPMVVVSERR